MYENIIAIPFRDRDAHLKHFIENTLPQIEEHLPNTRVVVIEQDKDRLFNRGVLLNVAFKEYQNKTKYFFTHDVDIIPTLDKVKTIYTREDIDVFRIKSAPGDRLGGIIKLKHDVIFDINGFPNYIWGWGIEDRALYYRCFIRNIDIKSNGNKAFKILPHRSNGVVRYSGEKKRISDMWRKDYIDSLDDKQKEDMVMNSGLNNLEYTILERKMIHNIVELIKVQI